ncbi:MAG: amino acid racemase [Bacteroidales bacterium]|nr:amino acid racemase [Bacteroidales bacterium]
MKTLGLIGGTGWVSTIEYYRLINAGINARLGGLNAALLILYSLNYGDVDKANQTNDSETVFALILDAARKLQKSGVDGLMLCANTTHMFAERISELVPLPLIHIGEATAQAIKKQGIFKVALLGTKFTMEMDFYRNKLVEAGLQMMVPEKDEREFIHSKIMDELLKDVFQPETKNGFLQIINSLIASGAEAIVLGCTEIPLLIHQGDVSVPVFNTLEIHANAAIDFALGE